ncbi:hypothetical protein NA78x_004212 [Anatilimnocola sp. NA78]|uniref:hypothetical protein n=1 Tax=Anatilimnocola sp. NA78 TaxID=3415683 RepID=UPI003CE45E9F
MYLSGKSLRACLVLVALCSLAGCNNSGMQPINGKVVWSDNDQPATELAGSLINFELKEKETSSRGQIKPDGSFHLTTISENDGAPLGVHTVLIIEIGRQPVPGSTMLAPGKIDTRYATPNTSDLKVTVERGMKQPVLKVDRFKN